LKGKAKMTNVKFLQATFKSKNEEQRTIWAKASAPTLDRDREIIRADAWQLDEFKKHPVLMVSHDYQALWIGKVEEITPKADGLYFKAVFAKTAEAEETWGLIRDTGIAAFSVGFIPISSENVPVKKLGPAEQKAALAAGLTLDSSVRVYTKVQLLEISVVSVPSNTSATLLALKSKARTPALRAALDFIDLADVKSENVLNWSREETQEAVEVRKRIEARIREEVELAVAKIRGRVI